MWKIVPIVLICLALIFSIGLKTVGGQESKKQLNSATYTALPKVKNVDSVHFDISARRNGTFTEAIEIKATLFNNGGDTIYFLTNTCEGEQYSLRYNAAKFILTSVKNCNASYPRLQKIAPKGHYDFQGRFRSNSMEAKITVGFDFYSVHKSIDLSQISLANIHNRPIKDQNVLWANEKTIE